jgi:hypothetical protein
MRAILFTTQLLATLPTIVGAVPSTVRTAKSYDVYEDSMPMGPRAKGKFDFVGVNEAGPEFGDGKFPGIKKKDVKFPIWLNRPLLTLLVYLAEPHHH